MSHFKPKMHQIRFSSSVRPSVRPSLRWSLTHNVSIQRTSEGIIMSRYPSSYRRCPKRVYTPHNWMHVGLLCAVKRTRQQSSHAVTSKFSQFGWDAELSRSEIPGYRNSSQVPVQSYSHSHWLASGLEYHHLRHHLFQYNKRQPIRRKPRGHTYELQRRDLNQIKSKIKIKSFISDNTVHRKKQRDRNRHEHRNTLSDTMELNYNSYSYENGKLIHLV